MRWMRGVGLALGVSVAVEGRAQAARDSAVFRPGQWGTEFAAGTSFQSLGVLRFRSPLTAWLLNVNASVISTSGTENAQDRETSGASVQLELGHRWYRALSPRIYQYVTAGALGGYARSDSEVGTGGNSREGQTTTLGVFGALGANWMVTPHLSLGAAWQASLSHQRGSATVRSPSCQAAPCEDDERSTQFNLGVGTLRVALYY